MPRLLKKISDARRAKNRRAQAYFEQYVGARRLSATIITAGLGVSRRADAWDEENQAYPKDSLITQSSVIRTYRIGPERDSQAG